MKSFEEILRILKENEDVIKKEFKVKEIGLFGSVVRGEETERSDIDLLIEFEEDGKNFDNYMELKFFLEDKFGGDIDLIIKSALKDRLKPVILEEVIYV